MELFDRIATRMTNSNGSKPSGPLLNNRACKFCGSPLQPLSTAEIRGVIRQFGAKRCCCREAREEWAIKDDLQSKQRVIIAERERANKIELLFRDSMLPAKWRTKTFEEYQLSPEKQKAFQMINEYASNFSTLTDYGLLLLGTVGTGKTHLASSIALHLLERGYSVMFGTVTALLNQIRKTFDNDKVTEHQIMHKFVNCNLLVMDELGKEKTSEWVGQTVYEIINRRYENNKPVVITTNLNLLEIRNKYNTISDAKYGDAIVDRVLEMCKGVDMKWTSWRKRIPN